MLVGNKTFLLFFNNVVFFVKKILKQNFFFEKLKSETTLSEDISLKFVGKVKKINVR